MKSPIRWFGGKSLLARRIISLFPPHNTYVEAFGGGASVLFAKEPSPVEIYNDLDSGLVNFFRVLRDREQFVEFHRLVALTPYSREEFGFCRQHWEDCDDPIERAYRWYVVVRQSFSGDFKGGWSHGKHRSSRNMGECVSRWLSTVDRLPEIAERLLRVQIENRDWRLILKTYDSPDTLFYLDPPYVPETRRAGKYTHELCLADHSELVERMLALKGKVVLSGYAHPLYEPLEVAGWQRYNIKTVCYATKVPISKRRLSRTEMIWVKP